MWTLKFWLNGKVRTLYRISAPRVRGRLNSLFWGEIKHNIRVMKKLSPFCRPGWCISWLLLTFPIINGLGMGDVIRNECRKGQTDTHWRMAAGFIGRHVVWDVSDKRSCFSGGAIRCHVKGFDFTLTGMVLLALVVCHFDQRHSLNKWKWNSCAYFICIYIKWKRQSYVLYVHAKFLFYSLIINEILVNCDKTEKKIKNTTNENEPQDKNIISCEVLDDCF